MTSNNKSHTRLIQMTDDQMKLIAHALSLVDRTKLNFEPVDGPFIDSVEAELISLQELFGEDLSEFDSSMLHGFCL